MTWREVARKVYECDGCGKDLVDPEFEMTSTFAMDAQISDYDLIDWGTGWALLDGKAYCPDCHHRCEATSSYDVVLGSAEACAEPECVEARG